MREVGLTRGHVALVDDSDFIDISRHKWTASVSRNRPQVYAYRQEMRGGRLVTIYLHRHLSGAQRGMVVDHIDGNSLNNCRSNLRVCSQGQNTKNRKKYSGTSQYKGVCWRPDKGKWAAAIRADGKRKFLGYFLDEKSAAIVYDAASRKYHGEFGRQNFA